MFIMIVKIRRLKIVCMPARFDLENILYSQNISTMKVMYVKVNQYFMQITVKTKIRKLPKSKNPRDFQSKKIK